MRHSLLALCFALSTFAAPTHAEDLLDVYRLAQENDAQLKGAEAARLAVLESKPQSEALLLPNISASANTTANQLDISQPASAAGVTHFNSNGYSLTLTQPVYHRDTYVQLRQADARIAQAEATYSATEQELMTRVATAYFDVLAAQDTLAFVRAQKVAVSEQLSFAKRNFEVGTTTVTDSREAQARYDLVIAQEIAAENDLRVKRLALDQLVGISGADPRPLALPVPLPTVQPDNVTTWVDTARDQQPGVRQAAIALDIARLETKKAETGHLPTVDLQVGYNVTRNPNGTVQSPGLNSRTNSASVGVALNLPLFAGFAVQNRVKETLALEEKAAADLETTRRNVAQATRAAFFGVQSGLGQVKALEAAEASSQSALDANKLGYQVGVRINIDVLNAQSQLFQTKRDLAQARYNVLLGTLKLRQAAGTLTQQDIEAINALLIKP